MKRREDGFDFKKFTDTWQAPIVARKDVGVFSGGLLNPRTMANLDCKGEGPGKIVIGKRVVYDVEELIRWLIRRSKQGGQND